MEPREEGAQIEPMIFSGGGLADDTTEEILIVFSLATASYYDLSPSMFL